METTAQVESKAFEMKPKLLMLDVYDTLLDMSLVERRVNDLLDTKRGYRIWFEMFMQYCFVDNCTVQFNDFFSIGMATLKMSAKLFNRPMDDDDCASTLELLKHLPLRENVQEGLSQLIHQQYKLVALTNAPQAMVANRMERTGLVSYFDLILSAETVQKYKPCKEVYEWASQQAEVSPEEVLFVSAHGWDIAGAANAHMFTAYLQQDEEMLYPLAPAPTIIKANLEELALELRNRFPE